MSNPTNSDKYNDRLYVLRAYAKQTVHTEQVTGWENAKQRAYRLENRFKEITLCLYGEDTRCFISEEGPTGRIRTARPPLSEAEGCAPVQMCDAQDILPGA